MAQSQINRNKKCSICLDNLDDINKYSCKKCKNEFHTNCVQEWINSQIQNRQKVTCPLCRATLKKDTKGNRLSNYVMNRNVHNTHNTHYVSLSLDERLNIMTYDTIQCIFKYMFKFLLVIIGILLLWYISNINYSNIPTPCIPIREEINDNGECQWDPVSWCANRGYIWFKSENYGSICNTDFCYRKIYTNNYY